jgi:hypothetical protein
MPSLKLFSFVCLVVLVAVPSEVQQTDLLVDESELLESLDD